MSPSIDLVVEAMVRDGNRVEWVPVRPAFGWGEPGPLALLNLRWRVEDDPGDGPGMASRIIDAKSSDTIPADATEAAKHSLGAAHRFVGVHSLRLVEARAIEGSSSWHLLISHLRRWKDAAGAIDVRLLITCDIPF